MMRTLAGAAVLALNLSGCGETRSVEYFKAHPEEAREIKMRCAANGMAGADCGNAVTALHALQREARSEEHTSGTPVTNAHLVCRLLLEKKNNKQSVRHLNQTYV